jgi:hypothetical protein
VLAQWQTRLAAAHDASQQAVTGVGGHRSRCL